METHYPIEVFWSDEKRAWVADVPDLRRCSAYGSAPQEAVAAVEHAIHAWMVAARATGRTVPQPSRRVAHA
jgi:predicted RNase H-like HicB family nuclease